MPKTIKYVKYSSQVVNCYGSFEGWMGHGVSMFNNLNSDIETGKIRTGDEIYAWLRNRPSIVCVVRKSDIMRAVEEECAEILESLASGTTSNASNVRDIYFAGKPQRTDFFDKNVIDKLSVVYTLGAETVKVEWGGIHWEITGARIPGNGMLRRLKRGQFAVPVGTMTPKRVNYMLEFTNGGWSSPEEVWDAKNEKFRPEWVPVVGEWTVRPV